MMAAQPTTTGREAGREGTGRDPGIPDACRHAYPPEGIGGEAVRAGLGLVLGAGLVLVAGPGGLVGLVGFGLTALFGAYAATIWSRRRTVILTDAEGIDCTTGLPASLPFGYGSRRIGWVELSGLTLRYFSTRRDRSDGWMQITLKGRSGTIVALSSISDFPVLAARAAQAADENGLALGHATRRNLEALGLREPQ